MKQMQIFYLKCGLRQASCLRQRNGWEQGNTDASQIGPVAQLVRATDSYMRGDELEKRDEGLFVMESREEILNELFKED